ncbi:hypothetical protein BDZ94DRAFT_413589 [Collybia nuda]|uniref:CBM1 domain-containing protein n=1 Tax=Collybia nuda TaxID=64659 RepID=A0A9P6CGF0_9AGAR|nr:hypothetical protein BDZ94DRAFT_413589 [Collybia nuda]
MQFSIAFPLAALTLLISTITAQAPGSQCGGIGWPGIMFCNPGSVCSKINDCEGLHGSLADQM